MSKKGISPLIAIILIVGFSIVLAIVLLNWANTLSKDVQDSTQERSEKNLFLSKDVSIDLKETTIAGDKINLLVENKGVKDIEDFIVRVYGFDGVDNIQVNSRLDSYGIKTFEITFDKNKVGIIKEVELLPIILFKGERVTCNLCYDNEIIDKSRSFLMGFVNFDYVEVNNYFDGYVEEELERIRHHSDLNVHQFEFGGVPWIESLNEDSESFPQSLKDDIKWRKDNAVSGRKTFLYVTSLNGYRDRLVENWASINKKQPLNKIGWENKKFNDPDVIKAYTYYVQYLIDELNPDYVSYGTEVNILGKKSPDNFDEFLVFSEQVYNNLKANNPGLPFMVSFVLEANFEVGEERIATDKLLPYTDYILVSTYPYFYVNVLDPACSIGGNPYVVTSDINCMPSDWFLRMKALAPEKPFAIAETGNIAEDIIADATGIIIRGKPEWQDLYMKVLLRNMNDLDAEFVVWWLIRDYDSYWDEVKNYPNPPWTPELKEMYSLWRDTGLLDGEGNYRKSFETWNDYLTIKN